ncbi:hypothetical protein [Morganella morganii]|uniref:hypothetical protein n=1 Tax=Morganella morganii TaxID=582 RepID=UPI0004686ED7|nr:hypothetical protein [Morganella morganii]
MGQMQGIQGGHTIQTLNNDIYGSAGGNSSSSYISSSGIKSVLLNAWNAVKSAISGMLSSFGVHLSGQQGSDKPGREIAMDISSRPAQPLPVDIQFDNDIYESCGENIYDSVYAGVSARLSLSESLYSEIEEPLYAKIGEGQDQTPPPVNLSTHPSLSRLPGSKAEAMDLAEDNYSLPHDNLKTVNEAQSEAIGLISTSIEENYAVPQDVMSAGSTPENDPRGDSNYDTPWKSQPDQQLQQRRIRERLNTL